MRPFKIAENIYWVGAIDWNVRDFHGYSTYQGTTYNAYLVMDEKVTLIDVVKKPFVRDMLDRVRQIVDPKKIDILISNHTEPDHTGAMPHVLDAIGADKPLYCSKMGHKNLQLHFHKDWNFQPVETGGTLKIGKRTLTFLETRMLHWPDSMFTYVNEDKLLFSSDAFGQHYAGPERFDDEVGDAIMPHALKYFANILTPYAPLILKLVEKVTDLGLELNTICPDHGVIWRQDPEKIINKYVEWSLQKPKKKAVVVFDSMWESTRMMAEAIVEGLVEKGIKTVPMRLRACHRSDIITEIHEAGAVIVGSPTLNNGLFPTVADFLAYMKGLRPQNKIGAAFGSYGWSGEAVKLIEAELDAAKMKLVEPGLNIHFVPGSEGLESCFEFGAKIGKALLARISD
ncbi:MAG: flavodoxin domain-containing protein [Deltaproteobacteria bacterium]|nr:flavodoxin domain-containing protein [Deltaproteobacteria bacterium]